MTIKALLLLSASALAFSTQNASIVTPPRTAHDITENYYNNAKNCGSENKPAFLCSGVLLRATAASANYHSWDPSPQSQASGGVSFSYLRTDAKFTRLAYGLKNGMIFYPHNKAPSDKYQIEVLCSFPVDADTDNRKNRGCGYHASYPDSSRSCRTMGIRTAHDWHQHYESIVQNSHQHQCGFDMQEGTSENGHYFYQSIQARRLMGNAFLTIQNELRLASWSPGTPGKLPVQAFFYIDGGLINAQRDQRDFYQHTGQIVPVIRLTLPASLSSDARFNYRAADQAVN
ncbi:hypothetical protein [Erwinia tasmaniensis]|uniref:Halovibrin n=1 Tax=Erwinia tasmaniensis (strain DSM 17950 / CFBP 7177 / CIP 109463 / NCPPB 4357 / Et1/99) TaxID=465817 RepID=B2VI43_ERWT9|nr:hypothetical protein [Erwinia tasmaniensis]CAO96035.1 Putative halovibrin [Erwinia tasmaniensis Et1/99]